MNILMRSCSSGEDAYHFTADLKDNPAVLTIKDSEILVNGELVGFLEGCEGIPITDVAIQDRNPARIRNKLGCWREE